LKGTALRRRWTRVQQPTFTIVGQPQGHRAHGNFSRHSDGVRTSKSGPRSSPERKWDIVSDHHARAASHSKLDETIVTRIV
jgi:hypothetical protein